MACLPIMKSKAVKKGRSSYRFPVLVPSLVSPLLFPVLTPSRVSPDLLPVLVGSLGSSTFSVGVVEEEELLVGFLARVGVDLAALIMESARSIAIA